MSQWTHFLGVIRFDSMSLNVWPEPEKKDEKVQKELDVIDRIFSDPTTLPWGSEGPIGVNTVLTDRGPTVLITGDLRDFGSEDLPRVVSWINKKLTEVKEIKSREMLIFLRDMFVNCDVEYNEKLFLIEENEDYTCKLNIYNKESK